MEIKIFLDSPHHMDLDLCKVNIESCSFPSSVSDLHLIEFPPYVDLSMDVKTMLGGEGLGLYHFLGIWIGSFLGKPTCSYFVDSAPLVVGIVIYCVELF